VYTVKFSHHVVRIRFMLFVEWRVHWYRSLSLLIADHAPQMIIPAQALKFWLVGAASLRFLSVVIGIFKPDIFKKRVFRLRPDYVNPLYGRTFSAWTFVTCMLCVLCAARMEEPTLYLATMGSFGVALLKFCAEYLVYKTVDTKGFMSPFIISSVSLVWMGAGWGTYTAYT
jgi:hypothetical protein